MIFHFEIFVLMKTFEAPGICFKDGGLFFW